MIALITVTTVVEAGAGLALLGLPSVTASLLFGMPLDSAAAVNLARIGGAAIVALAIICWLARRDEDSVASQGLVAAMLFYNVAVAGLLAFASIGQDMHGILLWPAVAFHFVMAAWSLAVASVAFFPGAAGTTAANTISAPSAAMPKRGTK
jgi:hypothetical protein